jgi:hypothetical protein
MRGGVGAAIFLLGVSCSSTHVVAGRNRTQVEQLEASLTARCDGLCAQLSVCCGDCPDGSCPCPAEQCPSACQQQMQPFLESEACASIGERFLSCSEALRCDEINATACAPAAADKRACPGIVDAFESVPQPDIPIDAGGTAGGGAASSTPPMGSSGGGAAP